MKKSFQFHRFAGGGNKLLKTHVVVWVMAGICFMLGSCQKDEPLMIGPDITGTGNSSGTLTWIGFSVDDWKAYPYVGGPGEDSLFLLWSPQLDLLYSKFDDRRIQTVMLKTKGGDLFEVPDDEGWTEVQPNRGFTYSSGRRLGAPSKILVSWSQKTPGTRPDTDSCFVAAY